MVLEYKTHVASNFFFQIRYCS